MSGREAEQTEDTQRTLCHQCLFIFDVDVPAPFEHEKCGERIYSNQRKLGIQVKHYTEKDIDSITIDVIRKKGERWGIELLSNEGEPSQISHVKPGSACGLSGVQAGDYILSINGVGCIDFEHEEIVDLISDAGKLLRLKVITPENLDGNIVIEGEEGDFESAEDGGGEAERGQEQQGRRHFRHSALAGVL